MMIYVTCKDNKEAKKIAKILLDKKLIACANIFPIESMYVWKGKITEDKECVLILKALEKNYKKIEEKIKRLHSYDVPFIGRINAKINKEYEMWMKR